LRGPERTDASLRFELGASKVERMVITSVGGPSLTFHRETVVK
jgi:hypothetical protein